MCVLRMKKGRSRMSCQAVAENGAWRVPTYGTRGMSSAKNISLPLL